MGSFESGDISQFCNVLGNPDTMAYLATPKGKEYVTEYLLQNLMGLREYLLDQEALTINGEQVEEIDASELLGESQSQMAVEIIEQSVTDTSVNLAANDDVSFLLDGLAGVEVFKDNPQLQAAVLESPEFVDDLVALSEEAAISIYNDNALQEDETLQVVGSDEPDMLIVEDGVDHGSIVFEHFNPNADTIRIIGGNAQPHDLKLQDLLDDEGELMSTKEFRAEHEDDDLLSQLVIEGDEDEVHLHMDHDEDGSIDNDEWEVVLDVAPPDEPVI